MYHLIILLFIIIIFSFSLRAKLENYTTLWTPGSMAAPPLINEQGGILSSAVNLDQEAKNKNYGNFGIIGKFPAIPICDNCGLEFDCVGYAYDHADDKNANVCRKCRQDGIFKNYGVLDGSPISVYARSTGRPRQCRRIYP